MKKTDILGIAFGNFRRRKTRSILSVLGVVIGTASIVCMMSLGIAMNVNMQEQMKRYGNMNQIRVNTGYDEKTGKRKEITDETIAQIQGIENVSAVTPTISLGGKVFSGKYQTYGNIQGIDMAYLQALGIQTTQGRLMNSEDVSTGKTLYCLMGASVPYQFEKPRRSRGRGGSIMISYGGGNTPEGVEVPDGGYAYDGKIFDENGIQVGTYPPEIDVMDKETRVKYTYDWSYGEHSPGEDLTVKKKATLYNLTALGILDEGFDNYGIFLDLETARKVKKEMDKWQNSQNGGTGTGTTKKQVESYDQLYVLSDNLDHTMEVVSAIKALGLEAYSNADWIKQQQESQNIMQMVLAGIGGVSLLVAAIGITNTMVMSIYERTREIGIMKVIGCYLKDIRTMFLTEAGIIGFFGGLAGVLLSYGVSAVMNFLSANGNGQSILGMSFGGGDGTSKMSVIPPWLALAAIAFAICIALVSGFFPARRAMKLSALTAMQN